MSILKQKKNEVLVDKTLTESNFSQKQNKEFKKEVIDKLLEIVQIKELKMKFFGMYTLKSIKKNSSI